MVEQRDAVLTFGIVIAVASAVEATIGFQMWLGFLTGVLVTHVSAPQSLAQILSDQRNNGHDTENYSRPDPLR